MRVLLVEDNEVDVQRCRGALASDVAPWPIQPVGQLAEALALEAPVDAILLDLDLPDAHGRSTLEMIRARWREQPVVVLVDDIDDDLASRLLTAGANDLVDKEELEQVDLRAILEETLIEEPLWVPDSGQAILEILRDDHVVETVPFGSRGLAVGRAPDNHIAVENPHISRHHALVWVEGDEVWVEDLGSTNGTEADGERIAEPTRVSRSVRFGEMLEARIRPVQASGRKSVDASSLSIVVRFEEYQETDGQGATLGVGAVTLRTRQAPEDTGPAWYGLLPYRIHATVEAPCRARIAAPEARITLIHRDAVALIWGLARRLEEDRSSGRAADEAGWLTSDELAVSIWGHRQAERQHRGALPLLLHRLRGALDEAGLGAAVIETQRGSVRLAVQEAVAS